MDFSSRETLDFGWRTFKRRPWFFVGATLVLMLASGFTDRLSTAVDAAITGSGAEGSFIGGVISIGLATLLSMGGTAFFLAAHDHPDTVDLTALWHPRPFWKYLGASILVSLVVGLGMILLIVPGVIFGLMFMFATFVVIERELRPVAAMKESNRITSGHKWKLFGFLILLTLVNVLGVLALGVGLLVSIPVTALAFTHAYRVLGGEVAAQPEDASLAPAAAVTPPV